MKEQGQTQRERGTQGEEEGRKGFIVILFSREDPKERKEGRVDRRLCLTRRRRGRHHMREEREGKQKGLTWDRTRSFSSLTSWEGAQSSRWVRKRQRMRRESSVRTTSGMTRESSWRTNLGTENTWNSMPFSSLANCISAFGILHRVLVDEGSAGVCLQEESVWGLGVWSVLGLSQKGTEGDWRKRCDGFRFLGDFHIMANHAM